MSCHSSRLGGLHHKRQTNPCGQRWLDVAFHVRCHWPRWVCRVAWFTAGLGSTDSKGNTQFLYHCIDDFRSWCLLSYWKYQTRQLLGNCNPRLSSNLHCWWWRSYWNRDSRSVSCPGRVISPAHLRPPRPSLLINRHRFLNFWTASTLLTETELHNRPVGHTEPSNYATHRAEPRVPAN